MKHLLLVSAMMLTGCATDVAQTLGGPLGFETRDHAVARMSETPAVRPQAPNAAPVKHGSPAYVGPRVVAYNCNEPQKLGRAMACLYDSAGIEPDFWY